MGRNIGKHPAKVSGMLANMQQVDFTLKLVYKICGL